MRVFCMGGGALRCRQDVYSAGAEARLRKCCMHGGEKQLGSMPKRS